MRRAFTHGVGIDPNEPWLKIEAGMRWQNHSEIEISNMSVLTLLCDRVIRVGLFLKLVLLDENFSNF